MIYKEFSSNIYSFLPTIKNNYKSNGYLGMILYYDIVLFVFLLVYLLMYCKYVDTNRG